MLHAALEQHRRRHRKHIARPSHRAVLVICTITLIQSRTAEVHRTHGIADKRMQTGIKRLRIAGTLSEVQVLRCQHRLGSHEVRIHPLPAPGQRTAVEDHLDAEVIGVGQDILIQLHHLLLVAAEEVHLDAQDAVLLHPCHLLPSRSRLIHLAARSLRGIVPRAVRIIPQEQAYALLPSVSGQFLHLLIADLRIPESIHEHAAIAHGGREVDIPFLLVEITTGIHADDPRPRAFAIRIVFRSLVLRLHQVVRNRRLHDGSQRLTDCDRPPRRHCRQRHQRRHSPSAVHLLCQREPYFIGIILLVHEPASYIASVCPRLRDQHPAAAFPS